MTRTIALATAFIAVAGSLSADEIAPTDVVYEEGSVSASLTGVPGDPAQGAVVMTTRSLGNCVACHAIGTMPDVLFQGTIAPPLDGVADRYDEAQLRGLVANAKMTFDGTFMPAFYKTEGFIRPGDAYTGKAAPADLPPILTGQQIEDVVAYLMTLKE